MTAPHRDGRTITRDDIEAKLRELQGDVQAGADGVKALVPIVVAVGVVVVVGVAFLLGRRRGRLKTTIVEIRRV